MVSDFPRTLSLLRQEKKISQRKAAAELGVSQALLSHYENGVREPGLQFVVRAADYYGVSADFLLGRTMSRDGSAVNVEKLLEESEQQNNTLKGSAAAMLSKKLLINAVALLFDLLGRCGNLKLVQTVSNYFSILVYKSFRYLHLMRPGGSEEAFPVTADIFSEQCDSYLKRCEADFRRFIAHSEEELPNMQPIAMDQLQQEYPKYAPSMLSLLHAVSDKLDN